MSWTDERIATLKKMWKEGKSAAEIAKTLGKGVTRNAVIGKAHRMGLSGRPSPIKKPAPVKKEAPAKKETAAAPARAAKKSAPAPKANPALAKEVEELKSIQKSMIPPGGGVALIDLTERMCKWPIGDPREPDFTFCGRTNNTGTPYCAEHAAMAYQTSSRSRSLAAAAAQSRKEAAAAEAEVDDVDVDDDVEVDDED